MILNRFSKRCLCGEPARLATVGEVVDVLVARALRKQVPRRGSDAAVGEEELLCEAHRHGTLLAVMPRRRKNRNQRERESKAGIIQLTERVKQESERKRE